MNVDEVRQLLVYRAYKGLEGTSIVMMSNDIGPTQHTIMSHLGIRAVDNAPLHFVERKLTTDDMLKLPRLQSVPFDSYILTLKERDIIADLNELLKIVELYCSQQAGEEELDITPERYHFGVEEGITFHDLGPGSTSYHYLLTMRAHLIHVETSEKGFIGMDAVRTGYMSSQNLAIQRLTLEQMKQFADLTQKGWDLPDVFFDEAQSNAFMRKKERK